MFEYVFLKIVNAKTKMDVKAVQYAIKTITSLTETQKLELNILCEMQQKILIADEYIKMLEENVAQYEEFKNVASDVAELVMECIAEGENYTKEPIDNTHI